MFIGLNAPKFETMTQRLTYLLTRVKSRDASASKKHLFHPLFWKGTNIWQFLQRLLFEQSYKPTASKKSIKCCFLLCWWERHHNVQSTMMTTRPALSPASICFQFLHLFIGFRCRLVFWNVICEISLINCRKGKLLIQK